MDYWIWSIRQTRDRHAGGLVGLDALQERDAMCELNIIQQVERLSRTKILREAWQRGQRVSVHGLVYRLADGLLQDLDASLGPDNRHEERLRHAEAASLARARNPERTNR